LTNEIIDFEIKRKNYKKNDDFFKNYKDKQLKCFNSLFYNEQQEENSNEEIDHNNEFIDINKIQNENHNDLNNENEIIILNDNLEDQIKNKSDFICNYNRINFDQDILNLNNIDQNDYKIFKINISNIPK
jgi:hypothetical protein